MKAYDRILRAVRAHCWAIQPEKLEAILGFLELKASGELPSVETLQAIQSASTEAAARAQSVSASASGSVAVIPVYGIIMHRGNMMGDISGPRGTSTQQLSSQIRQAVADPGVQAIVLDVDSPGGTVDGVAELAAELLDARKQKKIVAVSDCLMASAAYWIASACSEIVVSPSSLTGSIGVYSAHEDDSAALDKAGVKVTLISYGENKTAGNPYEPLSDSARAEMQSRVNAYGVMFDRAVAKGRRMKAADVASKFGQGKVFGAADAVRIGMADSVGTLDDVLGRFGVKREGSQVAAHAQSFPGASVVADTDCTCDCDSCEEGDCDDCTTDDCNFAGCTCPAKKRKASVARASYAARIRQLQIAGA